MSSLNQGLEFCCIKDERWEERGSDNPVAGSGNWTWLRGVTAVTH